MRNIPEVPALIGLQQPNDKDLSQARAIVRLQNSVSPFQISGALMFSSC
jgi:hypothetical protein